MYEGKEKRLALIEELLIVANVEALSEEAVEERLLQAHEERLKDAIVESIQGEVIARASDMLSKELIRFKQVIYLKLVSLIIIRRKKFPSWLILLKMIEERGKQKKWVEDKLNRLYREEKIYSTKRL